MSQSEAWIVTALGMAVVYVGLLLCIFFIQLFSRISKRITWGDTGHGAAAAVSAPDPSTAQRSLEPIGADVLAVIATVLEVERTLYVSRPDFRLTIRRPAAQS